MSRVRAVVIAGLTALLALITIFLSIQMGTDDTGFSLPAFLLAAVGVFLMIRVSHNRVGMILALGGVAWLLYISAGEYARLSLQSEPGPFLGEYLAGLASFLPSDDPLVVAVATLVVFGLFNPLHVRVQRVVDRRFNRSRYDAERVVEGFAYSLQERVDPNRVVDGRIGTVTQTMQPAEIAVWIRE